MERKGTLEFDHTQALLDVVFGVIVALPLLGLPDTILAFMGTQTLEKMATVLLLAGALVFAVFYWLEVRHFLNEQMDFEEALLSVHTGGGFVSPLTVPGFVLGSLLMIALAAAMLRFAEVGAFRPFLFANVLFWAADLGGTRALKASYLPYGAELEEKRTEQEVAYAWYAGHIRSAFFYVYGAANAAFFMIALVFDFACHGSWVYRTVVAVAVIILPLFRHLLWRSSIFEHWVSRHCLVV